MENKKKRRFVEIERINKNAVKCCFKYKRSKLKLVGAFGLMSMSFIIPDGSLGIMFGIMLLSPLSLKHQLRNKREDIKYWIKKVWIRRGLRR